MHRYLFEMFKKYLRVPVDNRKYLKNILSIFKINFK